MKNLNVGDKGKAICDQCSSVVNTTYKMRNVPLSDSRKIVPDLLVACCDYCDTVVAIPAQETPKIKEFIENN